MVNPFGGVDHHLCHHTQFVAVVHIVHVRFRNHLSRQGRQPLEQDRHGRVAESMNESSKEPEFGVLLLLVVLCTTTIVGSPSPLSMLSLIGRHHPSPFDWMSNRSLSRFST